MIMVQQAAKKIGAAGGAAAGVELAARWLVADAPVIHMERFVPSRPDCGETALCPYLTSYQPEMISRLLFHHCSSAAAILQRRRHSNSTQSPRTPLFSTISCPSHHAVVIILASETELAYHAIPPH
jgi:hypothetical protein